MADFLTDRTFLLKLNRHKVRRYQAAIEVLDFQYEKPLARLEAKVVSGNINVAANSPTRRTASLQLLFDDQTFNIVDINNLIAIDKKIKLSIMIDNPFYHTEEYSKYGQRLEFKQGVFVITKASSSISTGGLNVQIQLSDKMAFLDGTVGGTLPACVVFHEKVIEDAKGNQTVEYPLIGEIIEEAVHHFGGEHVSRIVVSDVPTVGRIVLQYNGSSPIYFATVQEEHSDYRVRADGGSFIIGEPDESLKSYYTEKYIKGDNVGYKETPLTYPGELILKGGSKVSQVLDEIVKMLGNYEYFYDVDGIFHFQRQRNFLQTGDTPLNLSPEEDNAFQSLYIPRYSPTILMNEFLDLELVTSIGFSPNWANIKNDFVYWGNRTDKNSSNQRLVRYHLAIDKRPEDIPKELSLDGVTNTSLCHEDICEVRSTDDDSILRYQIGTAVNSGEKVIEDFLWSLDRCFPNQKDAWFNWREELYRRALMAYGTSTEGSYYDEELLAEWRFLFDPMSTFDRDGADSFQKKWEDKFGTSDDATTYNISRPWTGYNVDVYANPEKITYWLDLIDTTSNLGKYSVDRIGRRTIVTEDSKVNEVFQREINDIVFIEAPRDTKEWEETMERVQKEYVPVGQTYSFLQQDQWNYFKEVNCYGTCYEGVRGQLYSNLLYNSAVSLSTIPILYLDVNQCVRLSFQDKGVSGDYIINTVGISLGNTPSMTISLQEAMVVA